MEGNTGGGGLGGGGSDVELMSKTLQVEHKLFYFDLKENPRGRYLKISEKTTATRSTIIVPSDGVSWFLGLFNYYVNEDERDVVSKELQLETKVFYFDVGENRRGAFSQEVYAGLPKAVQGLNPAEVFCLNWRPNTIWRPKMTLATTSSPCFSSFQKMSTPTPSCPEATHHAQQPPITRS